MDVVIPTSLSEGSRSLYLVAMSPIDFANPGKPWPDCPFICSATKTDHAVEGRGFGGDNKAVAFNAFSSTFALTSARFSFWASVNAFLTRGLGFTATFFFGGFAFGFAEAFFTDPWVDFLVVAGFPAGVAFFARGFDMVVLAVVYDFWKECVNQVSGLECTPVASYELRAVQTRWTCHVHLLTRADDVWDRPAPILRIAVLPIEESIFQRQVCPQFVELLLML
jgi:hypothetical protein